MGLRTMGLDVGDKTVGVAVSDELGLTAQGVTTVRRSGLKSDLGVLANLARSHAVDRIVVGLPLNMNGTEGLRATTCRKFGDALAKRTGIPVEYWDERLTTVAAQRALLEGDLSRQKRKKVIDQVAASLILQSWMDSQIAKGQGRPE